MSKPKTGQRTFSFQESVIREMTRISEEVGAINLSQGLPDFSPPWEIIEKALQAIQKGDNQYTFTFGSLAFRKAIAQKYASANQIHANPETEVTVTCGASEALMNAILGLTDPGDEVIIFEPWYENYVPDCLMAQAPIRLVDLHEPDYTFDPQELEAAVTPKTKLILVNTPHNPTGRVYSKKELQFISHLCQKYNLIAVCDETYERILYDYHQHVSLGSLEGMEDRTVTICGLGKSYSVTGWRIGWAVAAQPLSTALRKVHDYLTVCAPSPFQSAGIAALGLNQSYYQKMRQQYVQRRKILLQALDEAGIEYYKPEGAYYIMADFSSVEWDKDRYKGKEYSSDRAFAEFMAREIGVAVVPGSSFYMDQTKGTDKVRLNFSKKQATLQRAAERLRKLKTK